MEKMKKREIKAKKKLVEKQKSEISAAQMKLKN